MFIVHYITNHLLNSKKASQQNILNNGAFPLSHLLDSTIPGKSIKPLSLLNELCSINQRLQSYTKITTWGITYNPSSDHSNSLLYAYHNIIKNLTNFNVAIARLKSLRKKPAVQYIQLLCNKFLNVSWIHKLWISSYVQQIYKTKWFWSDIFVIC